MKDFIVSLKETTTKHWFTYFQMTRTY